MPCLWFNLHGLPPDQPAFNLDTVFRYLVPDQFKDALRGTGPIGGISGDVSVRCRYLFVTYVFRGKGYWAT